ncbi:hypothetical protein DOTSEDRAFT_72576 [Dothistroma septosporum NZE10]|uniref:Uncharacterized protein n=1 Tax=Dothistroma septosporum (strain NZE10 / CBS 128990) TaxID=675120 RepID=M2YMR4_DOTSN|nr:hypothetical protein DOTSEDRAFT_72576 [Dothistroma septosporum NZE10]
MLPFNKVSKRYEESNMGRRIHVIGDRRNGVTLKIVRGYDVVKHRSVGSRIFVVGTVDAEHLQADLAVPPVITTGRRKDEDEGAGYADNVPIDDFERLCVAIKASGPSMGKAAEAAPGKRFRSEVKDCQ